MVILDFVTSCTRVNICPWLENYYQVFPIVALGPPEWDQTLARTPRSLVPDETNSDRVVSSNYGEIGLCDHLFESKYLPLA